jgi:hypothetical protein
MDAGLVYACRWVPLEECPPFGGRPIPWSRSSGSR